MCGTKSRGGACHERPVIASPEHASKKERALADTAADTLSPALQVADIDLDDKYTRTSGRVFLTGIQALVRLPLDQRRRDEKLGYNTAGYVSGYRGSPLGGMDHQFSGAKEHLDRHHVVFHPAVNEDPRRDRLLGNAASRARRRGSVRGRLLSLVRQGSGGGSHRRCLSPCQFRRHIEAGRCGGPARRRPRQRFLDHRPP